MDGQIRKAAKSTLGRNHGTVGQLGDGFHRPAGVENSACHGGGLRFGDPGRGHAGDLPFHRRGAAGPLQLHHGCKTGPDHARSHLPGGQLRRGDYGSPHQYAGDPFHGRDLLRRLSPLPAGAGGKSAGHRARELLHRRGHCRRHPHLLLCAPSPGRPEVLPRRLFRHRHVRPGDRGLLGRRQCDQGHRRGADRSSARNHRPGPRLGCLPLYLRVRPVL